MKATAVIVLVCGFAVAASAGPTPPNGKRARVDQSRPPTPPNTGGATDALPFSDNFDSYVNGSGLAGQGTWLLWATGSVDGVVSNAQSSSPSNSFKQVPQTDMVQTGSVSTGRWELSCKTYFPTANVGAGANDGGFIIGMNTWLATAPGSVVGHYSAQIQWHRGTNTVRNYDLQTQTTPLIYDAWVPFRMVIDLTSNKYDVWYNGIQLICQRAWSTGVAATGGQIKIEAFDIYSGNALATQYEMFFDDFKFAANCYANCDGSSSNPVLTANDFQCFLNEYAAGTCLANCDGSTSVPVLTANDFQCFLNAYAAGCT